MEKKKSVLLVLVDLLKTYKENSVKSKYKGSEGEKSKELFDIKDQICSLTNLVK